MNFLVGIIIGGMVGSFLGFLAFAILSSTKLRNMIERIHDLQRVNLSINKANEELQKMLEASDLGLANMENKNEALWKIIEELDAEELAFARLKNPDA